MFWPLVQHGGIALCVHGCDTAATKFIVLVVVVIATGQREAALRVSDQCGTMALRSTVAVNVVIPGQ